MLIKQKIGMLKDIVPAGRRIEYIRLEWYETTKKIMHKKTDQGQEIIMKFFGEVQSLQQDDVVYADDAMLICIDVLPVKAIVLLPVSMQEMAWLCYEIGNKHLPLFYENDQLSMPYEDPVFNMLVAAGYSPLVEDRKLLQQLKTSVAPHGYGRAIPLASGVLPLIGADDER